MPMCPMPPCTKRSLAYYRDEPGEMKKRIQNGRRSASKPAPAEIGAPSKRAAGSGDRTFFSLNVF